MGNRVGNKNYGTIYLGAVASLFAGLATVVGTLGIMAGFVTMMFLDIAFD